MRHLLSIVLNLLTYLISQSPTGNHVPISTATPPLCECPALPPWSLMDPLCGCPPHSAAAPTLHGSSLSLLRALIPHASPLCTDVVPQCGPPLSSDAHFVLSHLTALGLNCSGRERKTFSSPFIYLLFGVHVV